MNDLDHYLHLKLLYNAFSLRCQVGIYGRHAS